MHAKFACIVQRDGVCDALKTEETKSRVGVDALPSSSFVAIAIGKFTFARKSILWYRKFRYFDSRCIFHDIRLYFSTEKEREREREGGCTEENSVFYRTENAVSMTSTDKIECSLVLSTMSSLSGQQV